MQNKGTLRNEVIDIENPEQEFKRIDDKIKKLNNGFISLGYDYMNKISGRFSQNFFDSRDNILYRIDCCRFLNNNSWHVRTDFEKQSFNPLYLANAQFPTLWLTDCLVFNLGSLFDYVGGFLEFIVGNEGRTELKWMSIFKSFQSKDSHSKTVLAEPIVNMGKEFVNKLYSFRTEVIHNKIQTGGFNYEHAVKSDNKRFYQYCSTGFLKRFKTLKSEFPNKDITLHFANFWLLNKSLDYLIEIIELVKEHIEKKRKIAKGKEIITFKANKKSG